MEIRDVGNLSRINNDNKINKTNVRKGGDAKPVEDNVQISNEAMKKAEAAKFQNMVEKSPDVRMDKINEVKAKLESGYYDSEEVINKLAERLVEVGKQLELY